MLAPIPLIGITTYGANDQDQFMLPSGYVKSVRRAGGIPVLIAPGESRASELLTRLDGLVMAGGGDICPSRYGGTGHETIYSVDAHRDESELQLVHAALDRRLPLLCICRGMQLLNVALGGSLHPHVPDVYGETLLHRAPPRLPIPHDVELREDTRLATIMGGRSVACVSWHHQSVDRPGQGCHVVAQAVDGVVEAIELENRPEVIAVQWHPELSAHENQQQQRLFDELVRMAAED